MPDQAAIPVPIISIIDDDESLCQGVASLIRSSGYAARSFASAEAFLDWEGAEACACVITDIHMPGMSGIELHRILAAREAPVPVIMITARMEPGLTARLASSGVVCLLPKPFEPAALLACVEEALGRSP